jgi:hypothetical protein
MEDKDFKTASLAPDIRTTSPEVIFVNNKNASDRGWFMFWAPFNTIHSGGVGMVAGILQRDGVVVYRDPKAIRFILDPLPIETQVEPL